MFPISWFVLAVVVVAAAAAAAADIAHSSTVGHDTHTMFLRSGACPYAAGGVIGVTLAFYVFTLCSRQSMLPGVLGFCLLWLSPGCLLALLVNRGYSNACHSLMKGPLTAGFIDSSWSCC